MPYISQIIKKNFYIIKSSVYLNNIYRYRLDSTSNAVTNTILLALLGVKLDVQSVKCCLLAKQL